MDAIISAAITGGLALLGVIWTNLASNQRFESELKKSQAVMDTKIEELTREVREHNNFARRMPVLEERVEGIKHRIDDIERRD